jgi:diguanylate cyclase (GGDEF)-like protein
VDIRTFETVTDLLPEAMLLVDVGGVIHAANRRAGATLAPPGAPLAGRSLPAFTRGRANRLRRFLLSCAGCRVPRSLRLRVRGVDGRPLSFHAFGAAVSTSGRGGEPLIQLRLAEPERADPRVAQLADLQRELAEQRRVQRELAEQVRRLERLALRDALTGLANRTLFHDRLERAVAVARREGHRACVLMIDLDGFKAVNDTLGHHAGDRVLRDVARRLCSILRDADTVARLGGDEFAVLLETGADPDGAETAAVKIGQALDLPFAIEGRAFELRASVGWAFFPDDGADGEAVLRRADAAMYRTKRDGGALRRRGYVAAGRATVDHGWPVGRHSAFA